MKIKRYPLLYQIDLWVLPRLGPLIIGMALVLPLLRGALLQAQNWNELLEPASVGLDNLHAASSQSQIAMTTSLSATLLDGKVTSYPPEKTTYDRTIQSRLRLGTVAQISPTAAVQIVLEGFSFFKKLESQSEPRLIETQIHEAAAMQIAFHYKTQSQLLLSAGGRLLQLAKYQYESETPSVNSKTKIGQARFLTPYFGILKSAIFGTAGIVFRQGDEESRSIVKSAGTDQSELETEEKLYEAESISLLLDLNTGGGNSVIEISSVKAGGGGPRRSNGNTIYDDFVRFRCGYALGGSLLTTPPGPSLWLNYQTLSYATSQDVTLNSIPQYSLLFNWGQEVSLGYAYGGVKLLYGKDKQSIPEFNASLQQMGFGGELGLKFTF